MIALGAVLSRPVENFVRDLMMASVSPWTAPAADIVLVTVSEDTLRQFAYRSPIDRGFLAELVEKVAASQPKAIGIDILFDQPTESRKDRALEEALEAMQVPLIIASAGKEDGLAPRQQEFLAAFAPSARRGLATLARDGFDGVVRELFAGRQRDGAWQPGFAPAMAAAAGVEPPRERRAMVFYRTANAGPHPFATYPAHAAGLLPPEWFAGKYVLIGVDLPLDDRHPTPFVVTEGVKAGTLPGVAIHAHSLAQILAGDRVRGPGRAGIWAMALALCALAGWLSWRPLPVIVKPVIAAGLLGLFWAAGVLSFAGYGYYVPMVAPSILAAGVFALAAFLAWKRDAEERQFIQDAFSQYVSPAVVRSIVKDPGSLRLGGERRMITCVFTDLQGFTSFSESQPPERIAAVLNAYLDRICGLFVEHGATIDKLVGDSVVGFFGAPMDQPDQARRAVGLALAIDRLSGDFGAELRKEGINIGITRVGAHSGPAIVGNFGGRRFFDYTAIGDTVNTAARLEGANKYVGTRLCVSGTVAAGAGDHTLRPTGIIYLKGKSDGIEAFEPLTCEQAEQTYIKEYCEAYRLMKRNDARALEQFAKLAMLHPEDRLIGYHHGRLALGQTGADIRLSEK